jgi:hypothetical protein
MVQIGYLNDIIDRDFEDYVSMKLATKHKLGAHKQHEKILHRTQTSPTSATAVEVSEKGGLTISDAGKTALTLLFCGTPDAGADAMHGATIIGHYLTNAGVAKEVKGTFNDTYTTEVAFCSDFYCWNLRDYDLTNVIHVDRVVVGTVYIGLTGMVAGAEKRYATVATGAQTAAAATLFGVGNVFGAEEVNTAGDVGKVVDLDYYTPWGIPYTGTFTLAADTTTIVRVTDKTSGYPVLDFYRVKTLDTTGLVGKYVIIGIDADKVVGTVALDTFYGVIEEGNYESVHSRIFVPAAAYGKTYLGDLEVAVGTATYPLTVYCIYQIKGAVTTKQQQWTFIMGANNPIIFAVELEPLSEVTLKIADDAAHPVVASMTMRHIALEV